MQLSPHFSLEEMTATQVRGVNNAPPQVIIDTLRDTASRIEKVRSLLGDLPIHVNSGYRSPALNKAVGGVENSAHITGHAVDFVCPQFGTPLDICRAILKSGIRVDQAIWENTWVHISFAPAMRQEFMIMQNGKYTMGLPA